MAAQVHLGLPKFDVKLGPNFGYVFTKEAVEEMIRHHEVSTFSSFTIQQTRCTAAAKEGPGTGDKGGPRIYWQDVATSKFSVPAAAIPFDGIPYTYVSRLLYECHHGKDWKEKQKLLKQDQRKQVGEHGYVGTKSRRLIQPTKKLNCPAKLIVKEVFKYPDFKISQDTKHNRVVNSSKLRSALANVPVSSERRYYIYLPNNDDHKGTHVIGEAMEQNHWKKEVKERKKKKREERLIRLAEQQIREKKDFSSNGKEEKEEDNQGRPWTLSIALPGSILDNAQSPELRTYLAGQIARAVTIFNIDEIIIFDESGAAARENTDGVFSGIGKKGNANVQLARILQYLECPQYLRKIFFPRHSDLQYAGLLNPLDSPHHVRANEEVAYREGVVVDRPVAKGRGSLVNVGLYKEVEIDKKLQAGLRVTVKMNAKKASSKLSPCKVVSPSAPRLEAGLYWGYSVRLASSLGAVFTGCPFSADGYDLTIGTSERGTTADEVALPYFKHGLIVFGGVQGLEFSLEMDQALLVSDPSVLFDHYVNVCPNQGSRTIRTEEAVLITMATLRPKILSAQDSNR
ncbi:putative methyltransferase C9orf114 isoform X2 [Lytechinus variegatus]|uniref:putative methyltransferase C9orf114 isoform X2 n=1 Tax=Lytechinus variegatus TaxID=7654 RepID=UPI001BB29269|nr:putative methyltransferase C9orf114 isoform X2 [Lytechinus variegatus]